MDNLSSLNANDDRLKKIKRKLSSLESQVKRLRLEIQMDNQPPNSIGGENGDKENVSPQRYGRKTEKSVGVTVIEKDGKRQSVIVCNNPFEPNFDFDETSLEKEVDEEKAKQEEEEEEAKELFWCQFVGRKKKRKRQVPAQEPKVARSNPKLKQKRLTLRERVLRRNCFYSVPLTSSDEDDDNYNDDDDDEDDGDDNVNMADDNNDKDGAANDNDELPFFPRPSVDVKEAEKSKEEEEKKQEEEKKASALLKDSPRLIDGTMHYLVNCPSSDGDSDVDVDEFAADKADPESESADSDIAEDVKSLSIHDEDELAELASIPWPSLDEKKENGEVETKAQSSEEPAVLEVEQAVEITPPKFPQGGGISPTSTAGETPTQSSLGVFLVDTG